MCNEWVALYIYSQFGTYYNLLLFWNQKYEISKAENVWEDETLINTFVCKQTNQSILIHALNKQEQFTQNRNQAPFVASYTDKTKFPLPLKLNGIWSWWQFSFQF